MLLNLETEKNRQIHRIRERETFLTSEINGKEKVKDEAAGDWEIKEKENQMHCVNLDYILVPNYEQLKRFPGNSGKESTCPCRRRGFNPRSRMTPHGSVQLSPYITTEPVLQSRGAPTTEPVYLNSWSPRHLGLCSTPGKPLQWEACTSSQRVAATLHS